MTHAIVCPVCGQSGQVEKVSSLYLTGIEKRKHLRRTRLQDVLSSGSSPNPHADPYALSRKLAPPSSGKQAFTRPIHPDLVVLVFSGIVPIFLYNILASQPGKLLPVLAVVAAFYGLYFWQRKGLVARFEEKQAQQRAADERIQRGIARWMKLYYCACQDGVFEPGMSTLIPVDEMRDFLTETKSHPAR